MCAFNHSIRFWIIRISCGNLPPLFVNESNSGKHLIPLSPCIDLIIRPNCFSNRIMDFRSSADASAFLLIGYFIVLFAEFFDNSEEV